MQVREIMTANPACCTPESMLAEVAKMMVDNDCGLIPVVDSRDGMRPVGTITDRDITIRTVAAQQNPLTMKASDVMTSDIATVRPEMSLEECFDVMEGREIRRVLVVDEQGKCCGIVAQADVVQSDANPARTNRVIREISESAPSQHQQSWYRGMSRPFSSGSSGPLLSTMNLSPFLIGLGSGVALMYLFNHRNASPGSGYRTYDYSYTPADRVNAVNEQNFGRYVDAEQEVEKRQHDLEERVQTLRTEPNSPINEYADDADGLDANALHNKGRTAGQP